MLSATCAEDVDVVSFSAWLNDSWQAFPIWSALSLLFDFVQPNCSRWAVSQPIPLMINPSLLSDLHILTLTHSNSFTSHPSPMPLSESWLRQSVSSWLVPPAPFTTHSHPPLPIINPSLPLVRMRNAWVHSRLNEVNIAGMRPYVIAEPTPQKQKGACSSGEPQRTTQAFQCIGAKKKNGNKRGKKCWRAKVDHTIKSPWEGRLKCFWFQCHLA